jgi:hypothetical protein
MGIGVNHGIFEKSGNIYKLKIGLKETLGCWFVG